MDEAQAPAIRRRRSRDKAKQLVAEYEASDMDWQQFCRQHGIALVTLDRYRSRLRKAAAGSGGPQRWLAVELTGDPRVIPQGACSGLAVVATGGRRIEVAVGMLVRQEAGERAIRLARRRRWTEQGRAQPRGTGATGGRYRSGRE